MLYTNNLSPNCSLRRTLTITAIENLENNYIVINYLNLNFNMLSILFLNKFIFCESIASCVRLFQLSTTLFVKKRCIHIFFVNCQ